MAKKRKYPKRPKESASLEVWQRYAARCKEVDKYNAKVIADAKKKKALIEKIKRR